MRSHRVATLTLTAAVGLGAIVGTASQAFAAPNPSNSSVLVQSGHQGPVLGPQNLTVGTTPTTVLPTFPGSIATPPHVDPPVDPFPGGDVIADPGHGDCGPVAVPCGPGDIGLPDPCTPVPGGPDCHPDPCTTPRTNDAGNPCQPDPCTVPRTNAVGDPCHPDPCQVPRTNAVGDPCHHDDPCQQTPTTVGVRDAKVGRDDCQPDPCRTDQPTPRTSEAKDCGGTTGGTDGGTTGGGNLPHTGADIAVELAAGLGLTGFGVLLTRFARRAR